MGTMRSRHGSSERVQVTAKWSGATLGVWCVERGARFRAGRDAECEFPVDAETCDVVTVGAPASPRQLLVGGVSFDVDAIGDAIPWQAAPRRLPLIAATMVASFALHAGAAWLCSAAQREGEPIDPVTKVTARQLAAIRGYLARADARVESNGDVEEIPAEPPGSMPSLAPSWGSRQWSCKKQRGMRGERRLRWCVLHAHLRGTLRLQRGFCPCARRAVAGVLPSERVRTRRRHGQVPSHTLGRALVQGRHVRRCASRRQLGPSPL